MLAPADLKAFKKPHTIRTYFVARTFQYRVEITTPDLTRNLEQGWGDWGPMYTIELSPEQCFQISYHSDARDLHVQYELRPSHVELNSPMFAWDREKFPFYLEFEDEARDLRYLVYFDHSAKVDHTEVELAHRDSQVDQLIFSGAGKSKQSA